MNKFRALFWTSILGGSLLVSSGSALANSGHGRHGLSYQKHRPHLVRAYRNHRGKVINSLRPGLKHFDARGYYVRRHGHYYWVKHHRHFPHRYWRRYHRRDAWGRGPIGHVPRTVVIEREVEAERETPSIQIGPEELSVIIPFPW